MLEVLKGDFGTETVYAIYGSITEFGPKNGTPQLTPKVIKPKYEGRATYELLKGVGNRVYPVAEDLKTLGDDKIYPSLAALPETVDVLITCLKKNLAVKVVEEAAKAGIRKIIFQPGTDSSEALSLCKTKGIEAIKGCMLVHREVKGLTRFLSPCFYMGLRATKLKVR